MTIFSWYDLDEYEIVDGDTTGGDRKCYISFSFDNLGYDNNDNNNSNKTFFHPELQCYNLQCYIKAERDIVGVLVTGNNLRVNTAKQ